MSARRPRKKRRRCVVPTLGSGLEYLAAWKSLAKVQNRRDAATLAEG